MKKIPNIAFTLLICTLIIAALPTDAEGKIYEDTIRLHILANSDSQDDQELKIAVRDYLLSEYRTKLTLASSYEEAKLLTTNLLSEIERSAEQFIGNKGYDYKVKAMLDIEWYDTRDYGSFSLPNGYYTSLKIIIGNGNGKNWWCVMYPPLCTEIACESAAPDDGIIDYTKEEINLITSGKYNVKFKILEELSYLFTKKG